MLTKVYGQHSFHNKENMIYLIYKNGNILPKIGHKLLLFLFIYGVIIIQKGKILECDKIVMIKQKSKNDCIILNTLEELVKDLYSEFDRQSVPTVIFFKLVFINIIFGINSIITCEECKVNIVYRYF